MAGKGWRALVAAAVLAGTLAACNPLYVRSDVNTALIGAVHCSSYAWAGSFRESSPLRATIASPLNESRLRAAISAHLKVTVMADPGNADCLVGYGIGSVNVVSGGPYWGYPYGWWGYGDPWGWPGPYVYRQGIVSVDLYDAKSRQPLWHASVDQDLVGVSGTEAQQRIDAAVTAIFSRYPYST